MCLCAKPGSLGTAWGPAVPSAPSLMGVDLTVCARASYWPPGALSVLLSVHQRTDLGRLSAASDAPATAFSAQFSSL